MSRGRRPGREAGQPPRLVRDVYAGHTAGLVGRTLAATIPKPAARSGRAPI